MSGPTVFITGAAAGIGRATALLFAAHGYRVGAYDVDEVGLTRLAGDITGSGGSVHTSVLDVTNNTQWAERLAEFHADAGRLDILINNAGILRDRSFHKVDLADLLAVLDVHLTGSIRCAHAVWPLMRDQGYGRIVFTSSQNGTYGNFGQAGYATAKAAVLGLMKVLAIEGASKDIRTNTIVPVARSRMTVGSIIGDDADAESLPPEAVASGVLFLVGEAAPNGVILNAGGGCYSVSEIPETRGVYLGKDAQPEDVQAHWDEICAGGYVDVLENGPAQFTKFLGMARGAWPVSAEG
jgi:NAD(P)-dependent dehydrogenase (short-subunit alcohol dehydrogenase family)